MASLKTFKVCLSEDLPVITERDTNYIYFCYDKLLVFYGQNIYNDPFAIVEEVPENPITNMLYFTTDGYVRAYIDYSIVDLAYIESEDELEPLRQVGTTYFVHADKRYLDLQRRMIILPYENGSYELSIQAANNLKIDRSTIIGFNEETNHFEVIGNYQDFNMVFARGYRPKNVDPAIKTWVSDHRISSEIQISSEPGNAIQGLDDGLYAPQEPEDEEKATLEDFDLFKKEVQDYIDQLQDIMDKSEQVVNSTETFISNIVLEELETYYSDLDDAIANFDKYAAKIDSIESDVKEYADQEFNDAYEALSSIIYESYEDPWEDF